MEFAWMVIYVLSFIWDLVTAEFEKAASLKELFLVSPLYTVQR
jgi:hypothetical protein